MPYATTNSTAASSWHYVYPGYSQTSSHGFIPVTFSTSSGSSFTFHTDNIVVNPVEPERIPEIDYDEWSEFMDSDF